MTFKEKLLKLAESEGTVFIKNGIVTVYLKDGEVWDFTEPMQKGHACTCVHAPEEHHPNGCCIYGCGCKSVDGKNIPGRVLEAANLPS